MADRTQSDPRDEADGGMPEVDIVGRLAFLELGEGDRQRLHEIGDLLKARAASFVETFYRHLFAFDETARFLQDPALVERLKKLQVEHLESMLDAQWTTAYTERRLRVGDVHAQVGISPQIFLGAYSQYLQYCLRQISAGDDGAKAQLAEQLLSLQKAVFFDIGLTLDAYFTRATQNLRHALDLVYTANAELRQFAQLTSHDLKTPLATVANLCDEVLDEFGPEIPAEAARLIESARNRVFRMSSTIDELLSSTISLHEDGVCDVVSTDDAVAAAIDQVRPMLDQRKITLSVPEHLPCVIGDRVRIREVFYNLLSNAVKFIDKAAGRIAISYHVQPGECVFCVADNGCGIPPEELTRVFVPFRRLPDHRQVPGSGLGLYFVKNIVEQQHGRVWAESEPGQGSRFFVLLKLADVSNDPNADQSRDDPPRGDAR